MKFSYQRRLIRAALACLGLGVVLGFLMYAEPLAPDVVLAPYIRTVHVHLILVGGVIQMIMGVALWMFPRYADAPHYTSERSGMALFLIFNAGTILRSVGDALRPLDEVYRQAGMLGAALQVLGILFFIYLVNGRVRAPSGG